MFKATHVAPSRRDLLKKLSALGALGLAAKPFSVVADSKTSALPADSVWKNHSSYEQTRKLMQFKGNTCARYPDVIVHINDKQQLKQALRFATDNDLQVVCRGSGHNTAGAVLRNGGMLINVAALNKVDVDPVNKTISVQPGAIAAQLHSALAEHHLAFPLPVCHTVTIGGYILGGGLGRNDKYWTNGPACNALISANVMLASGEIIAVDKQRHSDIYWAMRGCGPAFFGAIMSMTLQVFDEVRAAYSRRYDYSLAELDKITTFFHDQRGETDPRVDLSISFTAGKDNEPQIRVSISACAESDNKTGLSAHKTAQSLIDQYEQRGLPNSYLSRSEFTPVDGSKMFTPDRTWGTNTDNIYTDDLTCLTKLASLYKQKPEGLMLSLGVNIDSQPMQDRADTCHTPKAPHLLQYHTVWQPGFDVSQAEAWERQFADIVAPFAKGHYINQLDNERYPNKVKDCFSPDKWQKLMTLRDKYDPTHRFHTYLGLS